MWKSIFRNKLSYFILLLFGLDLIWWSVIQYNNLADTPEAYYFNWSYGFIALSGVVIGIKTAMARWGGTRSMLGRGLIALSLGLLSQAIGVQLWFYYNVIAKVEVPYPSLADFGYFGLIPAYTYGALMFASAAGGKFSLRKSQGQLFAIIIPLITLYVAYTLFLKDVGIDSSNWLKTFLDLGYPLGEIIPVSIALFTLTLTSNLLGGKMRDRILFLVFAFFAQFLTEYTFLYAVGAETYVNGGIHDLLYATSYTIMSLALISFGSVD